MKLNFPSLKSAFSSLAARCLAVLAVGVTSQLAHAQTAGTISFIPVKGQYTATANYLATNFWGAQVVDGTYTAVLGLTTPNPRLDRVCADGTNNYYGDAAKMTGLSIPVLPNTNYTIRAVVNIEDNFSISFLRHINVAPALSFRVNGEAVSFVVPAYDAYVPVTGIWNSGTHTQVTSLGIWDDQGAGCGNDYYILGSDTMVYTPNATILAVDDIGTGVFSSGGQSVANVLVNDLLKGVTATLSTVNISQISATHPGLSLNPLTGAVTAATGTPAGTQKLVYQICEKTNPTNCSRATVSVGVKLAEPSITVVKALAGGGRINPADQFTVKLIQNWDKNARATGTTQGSGSNINAGTGSTGPIEVGYGYEGNIYKLAEEMAPGSVSALSAYTTAVGCQNKGPAGGTDVSTVRSFNETMGLDLGDTVVCTITNTSPSATTLTVRQLVQSPVPVNLLPPYTFNYTGTNGWSSAPLVNTSLNTFATSLPVTLTATNTATTVSTTLPQPRYFVSSFRCVDNNAAATGNPTGNLVSVRSTSVTIPAANVRAGSNLRCTLLLGHLTP